MGKLNGRVALITGGALGIGKCCAETLSREGAKVIIADILKEDGQAVAASIGASAQFVPMDVTLESSWQETCAMILERHGRFDILVNNAGISPAASIESCTLDLFRKVMALNLEAVFLGCKYAVETMKKAGNGGSIINMSSIAGLRANANLVAYNTSKAAVAMLTKSVALHCGTTRTGIRCNSIHPGTIRTRMVTDFANLQPDPAAALAAFSEGSVIGRLGEVEDIANMVLYLASDDSSFVTGSQMVVDGGMSL